MGKESTCNAEDARDASSIPGLERTPGGLTPAFLLAELHGQRSLVGYSPKGHKESDRTE